MRSQEAGDQLAGQLGLDDVADGAQALELVLRRQPIAALDLQRGHAAAHEVQHTRGQRVGELLLAGFAGGVDGVEEAAARLQDLHVRTPCVSQHELRAALAGEDGVRVAVDPARRHHPRVHRRQLASRPLGAIAPRADPRHLAPLDQDAGVLNEADDLRVAGLEVGLRIVGPQGLDLIGHGQRLLGVDEEGRRVHGRLRDESDES